MMDIFTEECLQNDLRNLMKEIEDQKNAPGRYIRDCKYMQLLTHLLLVDRRAFLILPKICVYATCVGVCAHARERADACAKVCTKSTGECQALMHGSWRCGNPLSISCPCSDYKIQE